VTTPVFVYCAVAGHGGPVQSVLSVRDGLSRYRYEWLAGAWSDEMRERARVNDASRLLEVARPKGMSSFTAMARLGRLVRHARKDRMVLHANGLTELSVLLPVLATMPVPVVAWIHNYEVPRKARLLMRARALLPGGLQVAAVSRFAASRARQVLGADREVSIIPNPLSEAVIAAKAPPNNGHLRIAYLGTDRHYKGFDYLVKTIERSKDLGFEWIIASRPYASDRRSWNRLMASANGRVKVLGRVGDVAEVYGRCDAVFVPSREESFCRVAAEAMANGLFVVGSDLEPLRELDSLGETISFFPVGDVDRALGRLRDVARLSPRERMDLGASAGHRARERFSVASVAFRLEALYDRALSGSVARERQTT